MPNFSGWRRWDKELGNLSDLQTTDKSSVVAAVNEIDGKNNIKTYTTLEQIGLSDAEMSPDDIVANMYIIDIAMAKAKGPCIACFKVDAFNFGSSIKRKFEQDTGIAGTVLASNPAYVKIDYMTSATHNTFKMELFIENKPNRERMFVFYANRDGENMNVYPFREVAYIEKQLEDIEFLNGWENYRGEFIIGKIGNFVNLTFVIDKGIREDATVLFVLPEGFRPRINRSCSLLAVSGNDGRARVVFYPDGSAKLYGIGNSTGYIIFSSGFTV